MRIMLWSTAVGCPLLLGVSVVLGEVLIPAGAAAMCICRSGRRSGEATHRLRTAGVDAVNVAGGMLAWEAADPPVVRDDGRPGTVA